MSRERCGAFSAERWRPRVGDATISQVRASPRATETKRQTKPTMTPLPDRLPLVIGVTGHRDLRDQDVPTLEREVAAIFARLRHDYLHGDTETPIIVLS